MNNYKEKYENLIEQLKKAKEEHGGYAFSSVIDKIIPELCESEDEKIRKSLIKSFENQHSCNFPTIDGFTREQIIAWLEKQAEKTIPKNIDDAALQYVDTCAVDGEVTHDNITEPYWNNHSMMNAYKAGWLEKQTKQNYIDADEDWYGFVRWFVKERTDNYTLIPSDDDIHNWGNIILNHARKLLEKKGEQDNTELYLERKDEEMLDNCIGLIQEIDSTQEEQDWLKSLKNKVQLQPKKE